MAQQKKMNPLEKSGVGVFDDATFAEFLHRLVPVQGYLTVLNVELLQTATVVSDQLDPSVGHQIAVAQTEFLQVGTAFGERPETGVADVALANVQRPEPGTGPGQHGDGVVADRFAAPDVQVPQLVAPARNHLQSGVAHLIALGHRKVTEQSPQLGQFVQPKVGDLITVGHAQLLESRTETRHEFNASV